MRGAIGGQPNPHLHEAGSLWPAAAEPRRWRTANPLRVRCYRKEAERQPRALPPASAYKDYNSQGALRFAPALWLLGRRYGGD